MKKLKHALALVLTFMLGLGLLPMSGAQAAAKIPAVAEKAAVLQNGTKAVKITANGYTIKRVTVNPTIKTLLRQSPPKML